MASPTVSARTTAQSTWSRATPPHDALPIRQLRQPAVSDKYFAIGAQVIASLGRFAFVAILIRFTPMAVMGGYFLLQSYEVVISLVLASALTAPVSVVAPRKDEAAADRVIRHAILLQVILVMMASVATFFIGRWFLADTISTLGLLSFCFALPFSCLYQQMRQIEQATFHGKRLACIEALCTFSLFAITLTIGLFGQLDQMTIWLGYAGAHAIPLALLLQKHRPRLDFSMILTDLKELIALGRFMLAGSVANSICQRSQPTMLQQLSGLVATANFGTAMTMVGPVRMLQMAVTSTLPQRMALKLEKRESAHRLFLAAFFGFGSVCTLAATILAVFPAPFAEIILGDPSKLCVTSLRLCALFIVLSSMTAVCVCALHAVHRPGWVLLLRSIAMLVAVGLGVVLVPIHGASGALAAMAVAEALCLVTILPMTFYFLNRNSS
ncbi:MAG: lipopolysaccharide biosynthesis protein [Phycisphaerae bacterium]